MFAIRRATFRYLSLQSSSARHAIQSRSISSLVLPIRPASQKVITSVTGISQRRWASDSAEDTPVSKLQPTPEEEVQNAIVQDNASEGFVSESRATESTTAAPGGTSSDRFSLSAPQPKPTVYIGNLFFDVTEADLRDHMGRVGTVKNVKLVRDARGLSKGFGYVTFENTEQATQAIEQWNNQIYEGRRVTIQYATYEVQPRPRRELPPLNTPSKTLFIGNMPFELTDRDMNDLFKSVRNVVDVRIAVDRRTGQPRGFAHADFIDVQSAMEAMKTLQSKEVYGRSLRLDYSYGSNASTRNQTRDARGRSNRQADDTNL